MPSLTRGVLAFTTLAAVYLFSYWVVFTQILADGMDNIVALVFACATAFFVWRQTVRIYTGGLLAHSLFGAVILGVVGFVGGFFGPKILLPDSPQGPLLGLFISGPIGLVAGGISGAVWHFVHRDSAS